MTVSQEETRLFRMKGQKWMKMVPLLTRTVVTL